jgi:hypothetical protein
VGVATDRARALLLPRWDHVPIKRNPALTMSGGEHQKPEIMRLPMQDRDHHRFIDLVARQRCDSNPRPFPTKTGNDKADCRHQRKRS